MANVVGTLVKDPDETRIFRMDWSAHLGTLLIANSAWTMTPTGLTLVTNGISTGNTKTYALISGGTANVTYYVTNTVHIANTSEIFQRTGKLDCREY